MKPLNVLGACAMLLMAGPALSHGVLERSEPAAGARLSVAPSEMRLHFSERVEPTFTTVKLVGPGGKELKTEKASAGKDDAKTIVQPLPALTSGAYSARWSTMGRDGHRVKGEIPFSVK
jgi:methionine-rich copper-binding protein CopC